MKHLPISGDNSFFIELYGRYRRDPHSVPVDWRVHFETLDDGEERGVPSAREVAARLIDGFRTHGHREAMLDPLGLAAGAAVPQLDEARRAVERIGADKGISVSLGGEERSATLSQLTGDLTRIYASTAALEASYIPDRDMQAWLYAHFERAMLSPAAPAEVERAYEAIALVDEFESFIDTKFPAKKRFGLEGAESTALAVKEILRAAAHASFDETVIGGMHRGRLSTLATVLGKPVALLLAEIKGRDLTAGGPDYTGDVPYHLGHTEQLTFDGRVLRVSISPHPSHLTVVAPVVAGLARAKRARRPGEDATLCLLLHTDAAFSGQGLVSELMQLSRLEGFDVGGTIHVVVNNQIGFTTLPSEGRSAVYCTDVAKLTNTPVLHVNGDDPLAVGRVANLAFAWRRAFRRDIIIDLVCYRRNGHNEIDEPRFTQPRIWNAIDSRQSLRTVFGGRLAADQPESHARVSSRVDAFRRTLEDAYAGIDTFKPNAPPSFQDGWNEVLRISSAGEPLEAETGVDRAVLLEVGRTICSLPQDFSPHPKVEKFYAGRLESIEAATEINLATAEALAFGTLLHEGVSIRLCGQDSVRGTFTQRHLAVYDMATPRRHFPLQAAARENAAFEGVNSPLSEYGVLGFEYGHSLARPDQLVLWEAQFGDFLNGAQVVVDQFIVSAEAKWQLMSGLVVLLPHGLEGQGPDHSSARIERLLQLCANGNMIVANPSTPANLFHLLRRQIKARWRKPLFVIAPKSLLRQKACVSDLAAFLPGTRFETVISDAVQRPEAITRIILCSGKIGYDLRRQCLAAGLADSVAIIRLEQLYPFPLPEITAALARFSGASTWKWCQEEPENQGAWPFVQNWMREVRTTRPIDLGYVGRGALPVSAGGSIDRHDIEQADIVNEALTA